MNLTTEQVAKARADFEAWFYGRGVSSFASKMLAWDAWLYLASHPELMPQHG